MKIKFFKKMFFKKKPNYVIVTKFDKNERFYIFDISYLSIFYKLGIKEMNLLVNNILNAVNRSKILEYKKSSNNCDLETPCFSNGEENRTPFFIVK
jgi:hypothetical protein